MKKILLVMDCENKFKGSYPSTESLDIDLLENLFKREGFAIEKVNYGDFVQKDINKYKNYYVMYTSSQAVNYKQYIMDLIFSLKEKNILIPEYKILKAHENKAYQEVLKKEVGIKSNNGKIYASKKDLMDNKKTMKFPVVLKTVNGSGSSGVFKINSFDELINVYDKISYSDKSKFFNIKLKLKKKLGLKFNDEWYDMQRTSGYVVIQDYIKRLDGDWKILVFGNKYYCLHRGIKAGDFRASGSGILNFDNLPSDEILTFAESIYKKLDVPCISLDVGFDSKKKCHLIEFQGLHFGPVTLKKSTGYFIKEKNKWVRKTEKPILEKEYVIAYSDYIKSRYENEK